jgi:hypothetical protein
VVLNPKRPQNNEAGTKVLADFILREKKGIRKAESISLWSELASERPATSQNAALCKSEACG